MAWAPVGLIGGGGRMGALFARLFPASGSLLRPIRTCASTTLAAPLTSNHSSSNGTRS